MGYTNNYYATLTKTDCNSNKMDNRLVEALTLLKVNEQKILDNEVLAKVSELFNNSQNIIYKEIKASTKNELFEKIKNMCSSLECVINRGLILIHGADYIEACEIIDSIIENNSESIRPELAFKSVKDYSDNLSLSLWFI